MRHYVVFQLFMPFLIGLFQTVLNNSDKRNLQGLCDLIHHRKSNVLLAALHRSHVTPVKSALVGKAFLGKAALFA